MLYNRCANRWKTWRKYFVIVGGIFIYLPIGVPWYFGNLATYINSYYHAKSPSEMDLVDPQWIFSAFFIAFSLAIIASGYITNMYGPRATVGLALLVHSGATFVSYYALQHSMIALITVFGAIGGLGAGLAYGPPLPVVIKWMPRRVGLASGALMTGFGGGAVFYNELITFFINPNNLKPDTTGLRTTCVSGSQVECAGEREVNNRTKKVVRYFSQPEVLDRVPEVFLLLGTLTVVLQLVGVSLLRLPVEGDETEEIELSEAQPIAPSKQPEAQDSDSKPKKETDEPAILDVNGSTSNEKTPIKATKVADDATNLSPMQVLKTGNFYILWFVLAFNHYGYIIKNNYYKEFGQLRIDNDHFLTTIGTVSTIGVSLARLLWGMATDWLGTKMTLMVFTMSTAVIAAFWYLSLLHSPGLYMLAVILVSAAFTGAFILIPLAAIRCFGEKHYASNYGLILSSQIVLNLISPPIIRLVLLYFGWFWLFLTIAVANVFGTVLLIFMTDVR